MKEVHLTRLVFGQTNRNNRLSVIHVQRSLYLATRRKVTTFKTLSRSPTVNDRTHCFIQFRPCVTKTRTFTRCILVITIRKFGQILHFCILFILVSIANTSIWLIWHFYIINFKWILSHREKERIRAAYLHRLHSLPLWGSFRIPLFSVQCDIICLVFLH